MVKWRGVVLRFRERKYGEVKEEGEKKREEIGFKPDFHLARLCRPARGHHAKLLPAPAFPVAAQSCR